jgi:hypothetical protein
MRHPRTHAVQKHTPESQEKVDPSIFGGEDRDEEGGAFWGSGPKLAQSRLPENSLFCQVYPVQSQNNERTGTSPVHCRTSALAINTYFQNSSTYYFYTGRHQTVFLLNVYLYDSLVLPEQIPEKLASQRPVPMTAHNR